MKNVFYGRVPVEHATALLRFQKKGIVQQAIHNLKYRGQQQIGSMFGAWLGAELAENPQFNEIDLVIPVPLHKRKLRKRGYNQVTGFGQEIARALGVPFRDDILVKIGTSNSQVFKKRFGRFTTQTVFNVSIPEAIDKKHVLVVDDLITTGATLEQCAESLLQNAQPQLSFATIAIA